MLKKAVFAAIMVAACCISFPAPCQVDGDGARAASTVEGDVRTLANELANAIVKRDTVAMERLLADDFVDINPDGAVSARAEFIAEYSGAPAGNMFDSAGFDASDSKVRSYGDVAVLTGRSTWHGHTSAGQAFTGVLVTSMVVVRRDGQWKISATHSSSVPPSQ